MNSLNKSKLGFEHGVWFAVETLISNRESVSAKELIQASNISRKQAIEFSNQTGFKTKEVMEELDFEKTWK